MSEKHWTRPMTSPSRRRHRALAALPRRSRSELGVPLSASHITPLQRIRATATTHRLRSGPAMRSLAAKPTMPTGIEPTMTAQASW